jgi:hypothetical protein
METRSCAVGKGKMENGTDDDDGWWVGLRFEPAVFFLLPRLPSLDCPGERPWLVPCLGKTA